MTRAEKLQTIAENEQKVYEAGRKSMVDPSKVIPKTATGTGKLIIGDVSEIPHDVEVRLSSDTITDFSEVEVKVHRTNCIPYPYFNTTNTSKGITFTDNGDGTITVNGTATANVGFGLVQDTKFTLPKGCYALSGCPSGLNKQIYINVSFSNNGTWVGEMLDYGTGITKDVSALTYTRVIMSIFISAGTVCDNLVFKPMLCIGFSPRPYEPYTATMYKANTDGSIDGIESISPTMVFIAEGIDITANYRKSYGVQIEYDRFWDTIQQNGRRTDYYYAFAGYSWTKGTFTPKYDLKGTRFTAAFGYTGLFEGSLIDILNEYGVTLDTSKATIMQSMFAYCGLSEIPHIDCSSVTGSTGFGSTFTNCSRLRKIQKVTVKEELTYPSTFVSCSSLEEIEFAGVIGNDLSLQWSTKLTHDSLMSLINCLKDYSTDTSGKTYTVTIGSTNLAKLTADEQKIARDKGWFIV